MFSLTHSTQDRKSFDDLQSVYVSLFDQVAGGWSQSIVEVVQENLILSLVLYVHGWQVHKNGIDLEWYGL